MHSEDGTVSSFFVVLAIATMAVVGLVYDGGQVIATTVEAREAAASAARIAAQQLSLSDLHQGTAGIDPVAATGAGHQALARTGHVGQVEVAGDQVTVTVTTSQPMRFLPAPARTITVSATATATSDTLGGS
jgi:Flp pilus assembly protein TadG